MKHVKVFERKCLIYLAGVFFTVTDLMSLFRSQLSMIRRLMYEWLRIIDTEPKHKNDNKWN